MDEQKAKQLASQLRKPEGEEGIKTGEWMNKGNKQINRDTLEVLNAEPNDNILEVGMGNGFFVKEILEKDPSIIYTGCDFSEVMVAEAKKNNADWVSKGQAKFICADVTSIPFNNNSFNKIFTINTIYFWKDKSKILNELKRVLQPDGKLIITLRPKHQMVKYPFTKHGFKMFSKEEITSLLSKNGFSIIQAIEKREPDFELNGEMVKMESLIVVAGKS